MEEIIKDIFTHTIRMIFLLFGLFYLYDKQNNIFMKIIFWIYFLMYMFIVYLTIFAIISNL